MRIVTWNMNVIGKSRAHGEAWAFLLETLNPDIALLQEVVIPEEVATDYSCLFAPRSPTLVWGSAILSRVGELELDWEDSSRGARLVRLPQSPGSGDSPS